MSYLHHLLSKYPFSCLITIVIWVLSLIPIPENPLSHISLIDKWTHLVMYGGLGGLIEIVQATCTKGVRSGEWLDFLADVIGTVIGQTIGILLARCFSKG